MPLSVYTDNHNMINILNSYHPDSGLELKKKKKKTFNTKLPLQKIVTMLSVNTKELRTKSHKE